MQSKIEIPAELHTFTRTVYGWRVTGQRVQPPRGMSWGFEHESILTCSKC